MTTWILLRGLAREARHWGGLPARLQAALPPGDQVLALDLPGNGARWRDRSPVRLQAMLDAVRADLGARGAPPPYAVVAVSLAGMVAMRWAATRADELRACVLINSSAGGISPPWERLQPSAGAALLRAALPGVPAAVREVAIWRLTSARAPDAQVLAQWTTWATQRPTRRVNALRQLVGATLFRPPEILAVPTLVLCSAGDRLVHPHCSYALARRWNLPLREHPWSGHDLPLDAPQWVVQQVVAWQARHEAAMKLP